MFILAKFEKLMIDKINKTLEKLEELTILLEDYQKWLEWKDLQKTIISMRKEYQQKSPL